MNLINGFRSELEKYPFLNNIIDSFISRIGVVFGAEHDNATGAHTDLTATTVTTTGDITGGEDGIFDGNVTADADGNDVSIGYPLGTSAGTEGRSGSGIEADFVGIGHTKFGLLGTVGSFDEVIFQMRSASDSWRPWQVRKEADGYHFMPGPLTNLTANKLCYLGSSTDGSSAGRWTNAYLQDCNASLGYTERGRTARMGEWTTFTPTRGASAGTWTAGTLSTSAYMLVGKTMTVAFYWFGTSVSNANVFLTITIPNGMTAAKDMSNPIVVRDNGGAYATGNWDVRSGGTVINIYNGPGYGATFQVSVTATEVYGVATFEVQ